ncbi:MAG: glycoside hydrolase family 88 protein [Opitutaceae bacterium]|nr:glycoside hydrolase family 88 protein [Opitutaceae bacterium]
MRPLFFPLVFLAAWPSSAWPAAEPVVAHRTELVTAAERVALRLVRENQAERNYRADLALEALLEFSAVLDRPAWREQVVSVLQRRGLKPDAVVPYRTQPFGCLTFALFRATGERGWLPEFVRQSGLCRDEHPRSPEGAVMHPRGAQRGGGHAMLIDAMQEYAARMVRTAAVTGDAAWLREGAAQFRLHRAILRDSGTGLWSQGRGWLGDQPGKLSPGAWSRGHGWLLRGLTASLAEAPLDSAEFREMQTLLREIADALLPRQLPGGLWPTLLHRPPADSPADASGSALIATAFSRAWREGWLPGPRARDAARRAFAALPACVDRDGVVLNVSPGPGPLESEADYLVREFPPGNDHGPFSLLFAAAESVRLQRHLARP